MNMRKTSWIVLGVVLLAWTARVATQSGAPKSGQWPNYGGDSGYTKYSPLDQINKNNVSQLKIAWRRASVTDEIKAGAPRLNVNSAFRATPLMVDGVLYASNGIGLVEAFDPGTGKTVWVQETDTPQERQGGSSARRIAYAGTGANARILSVRGEFLIAMDPKTGKLIRSFGKEGKVDLKPGMGPLARNFSWSSGPTVCNDVVLVGASMTDSPANMEEPPGKVQAFDIRTGAPKWQFNPIPKPGEVGAETWENDSWAYSGEANVWTLISADEQLGLAYLPTGAPTNDMYGGHRLGDNLFGNSTVCVRCATGERVWYFQTVHHDLWDYDTNVPPILIDIKVGGRDIKAAVQLSKQSMAYVFDRTNGKPVWPIEERPVPKSNTPGERTAATQPFPTKPLPYDRHGMKMPDDLIDFTPALRAQAIEISKKYVFGPIFTPPSVKGDGPNDTIATFQMPGATGGAEWGGAGWDPETNILYIPSITGALGADLFKGDPAKTNLKYTRGNRPLPEGPQGLPMTKPPYGRITAINMNTGDQVWQVPNGEGPRDHPALQGLNLPELGQPSRDMPLVTKTMMFLTQGDPIMVRTPPMGPGKWGNKIRAYDKQNGKVLWEMQMDAGSTGAMITYMHQGKQYIVIPIASRTHAAEFIALALP